MNNRSKVVSKSLSDEPGFEQRIADDLRESFPDSLAQVNADGFRPDLVIRSGNRVAIIEIKTGDPELPLPSSANVRMLILRDKLRIMFGDVVPVIVTNYMLDDAERKEMMAGGIKVVDIQEATYDPKLLSGEVAKIFGQGEPAAIS